VKRVLLAFLAFASVSRGVTFDEWKATQTDQDVHRLAAGWIAFNQPAQTPPTPDEIASQEAASDAAWRASAEYTNRVKAAAMVQGIQTVLSARGIQPRAREQVFSDVAAWVDAQADQVAALKVSLKLMAAYANLEALVGDVRGLISGERVISMDRNQPAVVEASQ